MTDESKVQMFDYHYSRKQELSQKVQRDLVSKIGIVNGRKFTERIPQGNTPKGMWPDSKLIYTGLRSDGESIPFDDTNQFLCEYSPDEFVDFYASWAQSLDIDEAIEEGGDIPHMSMCGRRFTYLVLKGSPVPEEIMKRYPDMTKLDSGPMRAMRIAVDKRGPQLYNYFYSSQAAAYQDQWQKWKDFPTISRVGSQKKRFTARTNAGRPSSSEWEDEYLLFTIAGGQEVHEQR